MPEMPVDTNPMNNPAKVKEYMSKPKDVTTETYDVVTSGKRKQKIITVKTYPNGTVKRHLSAQKIIKK